MLRRDTPLEAWEVRALQKYVRDQGSAALAVLAAQTLARRAQSIISRGLLASPGCPSVGAPRMALERLPATRLEYRLYALFAD